MTPQERNEVLEEAARIADHSVEMAHPASQGKSVGKRIARRIRALKSQPAEPAPARICARCGHPEREHMGSCLAFLGAMGKCGCHAFCPAEGQREPAPGGGVTVSYTDGKCPWPREEWKLEETWPGMPFGKTILRYGPGSSDFVQFPNEEMARACVEPLALATQLSGVRAENARLKEEIETLVAMEDAHKPTWDRMAKLAEDVMEIDGVIRTKYDAALSEARAEVERLKGEVERLRVALSKIASLDTFTYGQPVQIARFALDPPATHPKGSGT